jgi:hypothetical protein
LIALSFSALDPQRSSALVVNLHCTKTVGHLLDARSEEEPSALAALAGIFFDAANSANRDRFTLELAPQVVAAWAAPFGQGITAAGPRGGLWPERSAGWWRRLCEGGYLRFSGDEVRHPNFYCLGARCI